MPRHSQPRAQFTPGLALGTHSMGLDECLGRVATIRGATELYHCPNSLCVQLPPEGQAFLTFVLSAIRLEVTGTKGCFSRCTKEHLTFCKRTEQGQTQWLGLEAGRLHLRSRRAGALLPGH